MKRYKDYMDNLEVSDTLHEKLKNLETPAKRPMAWRKYGAAAAALVLVAGVGAYGLSRFAQKDGLGETVDHPAIGAVGPVREEIPAPEIADVPIPEPFPNPDIASEDDPYVPGSRTNGGYELIHGELVSYYVLPWLDWADASALPQTSMDYTLAPFDAHHRGVTWDDVRQFAGGEKNMADHLLWDEGMNWSGTVWFAEDGTPCAASLYTGYVRWGYGFCLSLEVMQGGEVPSCVVLPDGYYETSQWQDVKITALKNGGYMVDDDGVELTEKREVSFYSNGVGYKLTLHAHDAARADELCARFVRYAVDGGFHLYALSDEPIYEEDLPYEDGVLPDRGFPPAAATTAGILHPGDPGYIDPGEPTPEPGVMPEEDSAPWTTPYNPNMTAEAKTPTPSN